MLICSNPSQLQCPLATLVGWIGIGRDTGFKTFLKEIELCKFIAKEMNMYNQVLDLKKW